MSYTYSKAEDLGSDGWYGADGGNVQNPYDLSNDWSVAGYDVTHALSASASYKLPFGRGNRFSTGNRALNYIVGNWQLNSIFALTSGYPYTISSPPGIPNTGNAWERANQTGADTSLANPSPAKWFNTAAYVSPAEYTFGNVGRNTLRSDWIRNLDFSIFREFPIGESKRFEFRADAFNATNIPIWGFPDATTSDANFGRIFSTENTPRELQFALKFYW